MFTYFEEIDTVDLNNLYASSAIESIIRNTPNGSSPGIDALPYEFYKRHCKLLSPLLASAISDLLLSEEATPLPQHYPTLLGRLLPKKVPDGKDPHHLPFKRRVSIADADYRIASLAVNQLLISYAKAVITGNQSAFLLQRGMDENGLTTYLLMDISNTQPHLFSNDPEAPTRPPPNRRSPSCL